MKIFFTHHLMGQIKKETIFAKEHLHLLIGFAPCYRRLKTLNLLFFIFHDIFIITFLPFQPKLIELQLVVDSITASHLKR